MIIRRLLIPLLAFTSFLVTGLLIGNRLGNTVKDYHILVGENAQELNAADDPDRMNGFNAPQSPQITPPIPEIESNPEKALQRNILLVAVDDIDADQSRLEAVWLVLYLPEFPHVTLMPIYPRVVSDGSTLKIEADNEFAQKFILTPERQPSPAFFEAVLAKDIWWNNYLLVDKLTLEIFIDLLGGSTNKPHSSRDLHEESSASQAVAKLISTQADPQAGLLSQAQLAQRMCRMGAKQMQFVEKIKSMFAQINGHIITDLSPEQIATDVKRMLENGGSISCEFPSLALISPIR